MDHKQDVCVSGGRGGLRGRRSRVQACAGEGGGSRLYVLLAVAWAALTVYDVWDSRQGESEEDGDNVDDWGTPSAV